MPVVPIATLGTAVLSKYIYRLRRLLHDATSQFYDDAMLTDFINQARQRVAQESGCLRVNQQSIPLYYNVDTYDLPSNLPAGDRVVDILGISLYWGQTRVKMQQVSFTQLDAQVRYWTNYNQRPVMFARYGTSQVVIGPKPDQDYLSDWDTVLVPVDLVDDNSIEEINTPYQQAIPFYAAYLAKQYEQQFGESDVFMRQYMEQLRTAMAVNMRRVVANPYAR